MINEEEKIREALPSRMRKWMSAQSEPFDFGSMCDGLEIPQGPVRYYVRRLLEKYLKRGEVKIKSAFHWHNMETLDRILRGDFPGSLYFYNHSWCRKLDAPLKKKILKAMRLISFRDPFSVADLQALAKAPERSNVDKIIKRLLHENYIHRIGARACQGRRGKESLYRVTDLAKFRIDLL
jgi:hypothetical protein